MKQPRDTLLILGDTTRFEVVDERGRAYTADTTKIEISIQDEGKTFKIFVTRNPNLAVLEQLRSHLIN